MSKTFEEKVLSKLDIHDSDIKELKTDVKGLKKETHRLGVLFEEQMSKLDRILEIVLLNQKRLDRMDSLFPRVDDHENRISALESHVRA